MSSSSLALLVFLLATFCVGGLLFTFFQPQIAQAAQARKRLQLAVGDRAPTAPGRARTAGKPRRRSIEDTLKELEAKQKAKAKSRSRHSLTTALRQGGLGWSKTTYWCVCLATGLIVHAVTWLGFGLQGALAAGAGGLGALWLPRFYIRFRRSRRFRAFANEFPNAVDVIVRGVKSGLPLPDCLRVIAAEGQEPVRSEFRTIVDDQTLGIPVHEAVTRFAERIPLPETNFLATVITIQGQSGGNLTEALGNLSVVLRERKKMRAKIQAMSAEAKASAGIIGSLPSIVAGLLYLTSPSYITLLFTTTGGHIVLGVCAFWMSIGLLVMRNMINFDF